MRARPLLRLAIASGVAALAAVTAVAATPAGPAGAQTPVADEIDDTVAGISPDLANVRVEGAAANAAQDRFDDTLARLEAAIAARTGAEAELATLASREVQLTAGIAAETTLRKAAALALVDARAAVQAAAVSSYVVSTTYDELARIIDVESNVEIGAVLTYGDAAREDRQRAERAASAELDRASQALDAAQLERIAVRARTVEVTVARQTAAADEAAFTPELAVRAIERDRAKATSRVSGVDFTLVALDAYWRAAQANADCGVEWWALAGISRVEGRHGTFGGATLHANGDVSRPIIGIPLSGAANTAVINDTDGGTLDGDAVYDRAVGPMQFIPSTWARWGRDGDNDGDVDPQNLYDATAAAAEYLCFGRDLFTEEGIRAGYFSYNHSEAYVEAVLAHAYAYREFVIPAPPAVPAG